MYRCEILADSINPRGSRITTFLLTYPRIIHSEMMTHRMFSRNASSSRAIPFEKMVEAVEKDPFIPIAFQSKHTGMQGSNYITDRLKQDALSDEWLKARDLAIQQARLLYENDVTKQLCNRLLEPFSWITVLVTATDFDNFFSLRCPKYTYKGNVFKSQAECMKYYSSDELKGKDDYNYIKSLTYMDFMKLNKSPAEIHIQLIAEMMFNEYSNSTPVALKKGEWHMPFGELGDIPNINDVGVKIDTIRFKLIELDSITSFKLKVATARAARISYLNFEGKIDYQKDINLHDKLLEDRHHSPFEHCALALSNKKYFANFNGFASYRYLIDNVD